MRWNKSSQGSFANSAPAGAASSITSAPAGSACGIQLTAADRVWIIVLISGFLGLMVDGMDFMFLASSLPKLTKDLRLSDLQAGSLGSYSLLGMAIGGARLNFAPSVLPMPQAVAV